MNFEKIKWLKSENQRVNDEVNSLKKKHVELERRLKELTEYLGSKNNQLDTLKKRCEETKLQLTELAANEKRVAAIHDLEKNRYSKIRQAIEEHKEMLSRVTKRKMADHQQPVQVINPELASPNPFAYVSCSREYQLGEKERQLDDLKRLLEKREQEIVIKRNHNAARIVRLRKLLQSNEAKRTLCKEQLAALKAKTNRRY
ncbi:uncharacterized protein LOC135713438 isoform X2 [Ochlerotatus camptorhynchus]|uniref:uncharacterized protein LOC135713438 isoform X2 n=1 Tax=Ochlerotatus camptorhynchus TaxID=644619 RepID=UPI0031E09BED